MTRLQDGGAVIQKSDSDLKPLYPAFLCQMYPLGAAFPACLTLQAKTMADGKPRPGAGITATYRGSKATPTDENQSFARD